MQKLFRGTATISGPVPATSSWIKPDPNRKFLFSMPFSFHLSHTKPFPHHPKIIKHRSHVVCRCGPGALKRAWAPSLRPSSTWRGFRAAEGSRNHEKGGILDGFDGDEGESKIGEENDGGLNEKKLESMNSDGSNSGRVVYRRQRGTVVANADLLTKPAVRQRNLRKLVDKGFEVVAQLKQLYKDKFYGNSSPKMVEFLRSSVGIIHKNHAESIASFIKESVDEELKEEDNSTEPKPIQMKRLTFCVEGNISVGKTTFLQRIASETLNCVILLK